MGVWTKLIWDHLLSLHVPNIAEKSAVAALYPVLVVVGRLERRSSTDIGLALSMIGAGRVIAALPTAAVYPIVGLDGCQWIGVAVAGIGVLLSLLVSALWWPLCGTLLIFALGTGAMSSARQPLIYFSSAPEHVGRVSSLIGGGARWAQVIGPLAAGAAMQWGSVYVALCCNLLLLAIAAMSMWAGAAQLRECQHRAALCATADVTIMGALRIMNRQKKAFFELFLLAMSLGIFRFGRRMLIPLIASASGFDPLQTSTAISLSYAIDSLFFWVGGWLLDVKGRRWAAVPSFAAFAVAFVILASRSSTLSFFVAIELMGVAEAMSCGIVNTLICDIVPRDAGTTLYVLLRVLPDIAAPVAPLLIGAVLNISSIGVVCLALSVASCMASVMGTSSDVCIGRRDLRHDGETLHNETPPADDNDGVELDALVQPHDTSAIPHMGEQQQP